MEMKNKKSKNTNTESKKTRKRDKTEGYRVTRKYPLWFRLLFALIVLLVLGVCACIFCLSVSGHIVDTTEDRIYPAVNSENGELPEGGYDCIFILGCGVRADGTPTPMLYDRVSTGASLYEAGVAPKILVSGDHGTAEYDEVNTMKDLLVSMGVPEEDIFMDHAGFSTYESLYRAAYIFGVEKAVIVSQEFHLPRALYIAERRGIEAVGVSADLQAYAGVKYNYAREIPASVKDFFACDFGVKPTYLGEKISLDQSGIVTADKTR